jgi:putative Mn2+ efflux pump MntP
MKKDAQIKLFCFALAVFALVYFIYRKFYLLEPVTLLHLSLGFVSSALIAAALTKSRRIQSPDLSSYLSVAGCIFGAFAYLLPFAYYFELYLFSELFLFLAVFLAFILYLILTWYKNLWRL